MDGSLWHRLWQRLRALFSASPDPQEPDLPSAPSRRDDDARPPRDAAAGGTPAAPPVAEPRPAPAPPAASSEPIIFGIDFGTTYTSIGAFVDGHLKVLRDEAGTTMFPSVVCYPVPGTALVGWEAREQLPLHPTTAFQSPKRLIGRRYDDRKIEPVLASLAVPLRAGPNGQVVADVHGSPLAIPQVCAEIFRRAAEIGQEATGQPVRRVVLSAPVEYKTERTAIKRAAELAGMEVVSIVDEPIAAAIGYGLGRHSGLVAVYDFGGGTFDFTLLEVEGGRFRIRAKTGDAWLGGDDFDLVLAEHAARAFWRQCQVDLHHRRVEWQRLLVACESAKRELEERETLELRVAELALLPSGPVDLRLKLDRALLAQLCTPLVDRSIECMRECLQTAGVRPEEVGHVALTGGVSRMALVRERVEPFFGKPVHLAVDPQHAVVVGSAIYAHYLVAQPPARTAP